VEVRSEHGPVVVLDAGTGIRRLGLELAAAGVRELDLLLTHLHLDHVEGLGFFAPLFDADCVIRIHGPAGAALEQHIRAYLSPPHFPLRFEQLPARIVFQEHASGATFEAGALRVETAALCHPGPTVGYRLSDGARSLAYIPDNELALDPSAGATLADGVDMLIHDAQFSEEEYGARSGWGHSSIPDFAAFVCRTEPHAALMFHHDPAHADERLAELEGEARTASGRPDIRLAREGMELVLD
jgi:phosphoribosyl 1,2-cyclic phosphodiesterase